MTRCPEMPTVLRERGDLTARLLFALLVDRLGEGPSFARGPIQGWFLRARRKVENDAIALFISRVLSRRLGHSNSYWIHHAREQAVRLAAGKAEDGLAWT